MKPHVSSHFLSQVAGELPFISLLRAEDYRKIYCNQRFIKPEMTSPPRRSPVPARLTPKLNKTHGVVLPCEEHGLLRLPVPSKKLCSLHVVAASNTLYKHPTSTSPSTSLLAGVSPVGNPEENGMEWGCVWCSASSHNSFGPVMLAGSWFLPGAAMSPS